MRANNQSVEPELTDARVEFRLLGPDFRVRSKEKRHRR